MTVSVYWERLGRCCHILDFHVTRGEELLILSTDAESSHGTSAFSSGAAFPCQDGPISPFLLLLYAVQTFEAGLKTF